MTKNELQNGGKVIRCCVCGVPAPIDSNKDIPEDIPENWQSYIMTIPSISDSDCYYYYCEKCKWQNRSEWTDQFKMVKAV